MMGCFDRCPWNGVLPALCLNWRLPHRVSRLSILVCTHLKGSPTELHTCTSWSNNVRRRLQIHQSHVICFIYILFANRSLVVLLMLLPLKCICKWPSCDFLHEKRRLHQSRIEHNWRKTSISAPSWRIILICEKMLQWLCIMHKLLCLILCDCSWHRSSFFEYTFVWRIETFRCCESGGLFAPRRYNVVVHITRAVKNTSSVFA